MTHEQNKKFNKNIDHKKELNGNFGIKYFNE